MYVFPPKLQNLTTWFSTRDQSNTREMWEVSAPPDHSLYWSLMLSFVIASPEQSDWFERLLGSQKEIEGMMRKKRIPARKLDPKSIKKQIMNFNPFKNQHSFYQNDLMVTVFRLFSLRLNRTANEMNRYIESCDELKLNAATKMLKCCIQVYGTDAQGNKLPPALYAPVVNRAVLVLFKHSGVAKMYKTKSASRQSDHKVINVFGFGMSLHHVEPLRRDALVHILKRTDLSNQIIQRIRRDVSVDENFLVFLLGKDYKKDAVSSIYASPYIAWKLAAAGFVTDPCSLDRNGLSAFYHCLGLESTFLLHVLYDYASNSFEHSDKTTRNPDFEILKALKRIGRTLQSDCSKTDRFSTLRDTAFKSFGEISCFNEYQCFVVEKIAESNLSSQASQPDIKRRKDIISSILEFYPAYFCHPDANQAVENKNSKFQNFIEHSEYYENLDNYTCLLFFDNFLYLDLPTEVMNSAVQNLCLTVFSYSLFPKCLDHGVHCTEHSHTSEDCSLRVIPFIFRSRFLESAKAVQKELERPLEDCAVGSQKSNKEHDPHSVVVQITSGLKDLPEIKSEFSIGRLKRYLKTTTALSIDDMKGVLTVERALQVIGETLNTSESDSVIGHLLCSCLGEVVEEFFRIRNHCLSHYRPRTMGGKLSLEKEILRFINLQDIIADLHSLVEPVYESQKLRIVDFMIETGARESKDIDPTLAQSMESERNGKNRLLLEIYVRNKSKYKCLANNLLNYIEKEAGMETCRKFQKTGQISALKFLFHFLASQSNDSYKKEIFGILQDLDGLNKEFESKANATKQKDIKISTSERQEITRIVSELRKVSISIFSEVKDEPRKEICSSDVKAFFDDVRKFSWFTDEEMAVIKEKISHRLQSSLVAKASLKDFLSQNTSQLSLPKAQQLLVDIFATQKDKDFMAKNLSGDHHTALKRLNSVKRDEQDIFKRMTDLEDDLDCLMRFSETAEGTRLLLEIDLSEDLNLKMLQFLNRKVEFLLDRIGHLKSILINEDEEILSLWNWGRSEAIKTHTKYLMCQRYRRERAVRASLEMLLFDCMNILTSRKSLSRLWTKANDLFSGTSLRDVLSHGSTLLEIVGGCLDQDDLPSHLVDRMLELVEDGDALNVLSALWQKRRVTDLGQFQSMLKDEDPSLREVQRWMRKRGEGVGGWTDYLPLLPLK